MWSVLVWTVRTGPLMSKAWFGFFEQIRIMLSVASIKRTFCRSCGDRVLSLHGPIPPLCQENGPLRLYSPLCRRHHPLLSTHIPNRSYRTATFLIQYLFKTGPKRISDALSCRTFVLPLTQRLSGNFLLFSPTSRLPLLSLEEVFCSTTASTSTSP